MCYHSVTIAYKDTSTNGEHFEVRKHWGEKVIILSYNLLDKNYSQKWTHQK